MRKEKGSWKSCVVYDYCKTARNNGKEVHACWMFIAAEWRSEEMSEMTNYPCVPCMHDTATTATRTTQRLARHSDSHDPAIHTTQRLTHSNGERSKGRGLLHPFPCGAARSPRKFSINPPPNRAFWWKLSTKFHTHSSFSYIHLSTLSPILSNPNLLTLYILENFEIITANDPDIFWTLKSLELNMQ